jgi:hypothetical protein
MLVLAFGVGSIARYMTLACIGLIFLSPAEAAEYYKWVDASGVTHYSEAPPPSSVAIEKITTSGNQDPSKMDNAVDASVDTAKDAKEQKPDALAQAETAFCADVRQRLSVLNSGHETVEFDADGTHTHPMTAEQVAARRADLESKLSQFCKPAVKQADAGAKGNS